LGSVKLDMENQFIPLAALAFLLIAFLYSSVGHAGASGYLAIMALFSFPVETIKPASLALNIAVSAIASYQFLKAGCFDRKVFFTFAASSVPMAFVGGYIQPDPKLFVVLAGLFLIVSSILLLVRSYIRPSDQPRAASLPAGLLIGGTIGLFSGLLGVGGGIFLSPILILSNWAPVRKVSGIAALFILCNSVLALGGHVAAFRTLEFDILYWLMAVIAGGTAGSYFGSKRFNNRIILVLLSAVLFTAGLKFLLVG
jgi:uncharacterized protein